MQIREDKFREPDLVVLLDEDDPRGQDAYFLGADLVVEVVSPDNPERDTVEKVADYCSTKEQVGGVPYLSIYRPLRDASGNAYAYLNIPSFSTQDELIGSMNEKLQIPGMPVAWTQPIRNRLDMLATGVRTKVGVKVYGSDYPTIEKVSLDVENALKELARDAAETPALQPLADRAQDVADKEMRRSDRALQAATSEQLIIDLTRGVVCKSGGRPWESVASIASRMDVRSLRHDWTSPISPTCDARAYRESATGRARE